MNGVNQRVCIFVCESAKASESWRVEKKEKGKEGGYRKKRKGDKEGRTPVSDKLDLGLFPSLSTNSQPVQVQSNLLPFFSLSTCLLFLSLVVDSACGKHRFLSPTLAQRNIFFLSPSDLHERRERRCLDPHIPMPTIQSHTHGGVEDRCVKIPEFHSDNSSFFPPIASPNKRRGRDEM